MKDLDFGGQKMVQRNKMMRVRERKMSRGSCWKWREELELKRHYYGGESEKENSLT